MLLAADDGGGLVQTSFIVASRGAAINAIGKFPAEFRSKAAKALVADVRAAGSEHLFDHSQAQRGPKIEPRSSELHTLCESTVDDKIGPRRERGGWAR